MGGWKSHWFHIWQCTQTENWKHGAINPAKTAPTKYRHWYLMRVLCQVAILVNTQVASNKTSPKIDPLWWFEVEFWWRFWSWSLVEIRTVNDDHDWCHKNITEWRLDYQSQHFHLKLPVRWISQTRQIPRSSDSDDNLRYDLKALPFVEVLNRLSVAPLAMFIFLAISFYNFFISI